MVRRFVGIGSIYKKYGEMQYFTRANKRLTFIIFRYNSPRVAVFCSYFESSRVPTFHTCSLCFGVSPSGKAADFDSAIPRFES